MKKSRDASLGIFYDLKFLKNFEHIVLIFTVIEVHRALGLIEPTVFIDAYGFCSVILIIVSDKDYFAVRINEPRTFRGILRIASVCKYFYI